MNPPEQAAPRSAVTLTRPNTNRRWRPTDMNTETVTTLQDILRKMFDTIDR